MTVGAPVSDSVTAPIFARPSSRGAERTGVRLAWATGLGWAAVAVAIVSYIGAYTVGRASVLGILLAVGVVAVSVPWFNRVARRTPDIALAGLLRLSLGLKLMATLPRFELRQDSRDYYRVGSSLANHFRSFDFFVDPGQSVPGTGSVRYMTGLVQVFTLEDEFATFLVFSLVGFVGVVFFLQAFSIALPSIDIRRYALLVLLWPTLIYWPSSIGKDAVMIFGLGAVAYGLARLMHGRLTGVLFAIPGLLICGLVRPHVALIAVFAAVAALIVRSPRHSAGSTVTKFILIGGLLVGGAIASNAVEGIFDIDGLNPTGVSRALDIASQRSAQGGSSFSAARIDGVSDFPMGLITVLFRPFPTEAESVAIVLTSLEGLLLAGLALVAIPRVMAAVRHIRREAYVVYAAGFSLVFVYLFSALGNFGILARQRSMTLPLVLVIAALPTARERVRRQRTMTRSEES